MHLDYPCSSPKINFSQARSSHSWSLCLFQLNELMEGQWEAAVSWAASGMLHSASSGSPMISFYLDTSHLIQLKPPHFPSPPAAHKPQVEHSWHETPKAMKNLIWLWRISCWEQDFGPSDLLSSLPTQVSLHSSTRGSIKIMGGLLGIKSHCSKDRELSPHL